jgi:hypothetical protein
MSTTRFLVVEIDPSAEYEWNRLSVRDPLASSDVKLADLVAEALQHQHGSHLVKVTINVEPLSCRTPESEQSLPIAA